MSTAAYPTSSHLEIWRLSELERRIGMKKSWIYDQVKAGAFPQPVHIGARARGWLADEVNAWIAARAASRKI